MSENGNNESNGARENNDLKIDAVTAKRFFFRYHKNANNPNPGIDNSQGKLTVKVNGGNKPIQHLVLRAEIFINLRDAVQNANYTFIGIAALPATNDDGSDTLLLVAIAENNQGQQFYFLPPNITDVDYIYDYIDSCPEFCNQIVNHQKVWESWIQ